MSETLPAGPLVAWYGDDFTGSAAVMEVLTFGGLPSVLFLAPPTAEEIARFPGMRGIGIASLARAQSPAWMDDNLPAPFEWMKASAAPVCHYKTCSTFDSAPHIGSIGRAADIGRRVFAGAMIPLYIAAPALRRYQAFGHLFAGAGAAVYRLDRHPVMAHHPVTPMREADVTRHLAAQTQQAIRLLDLNMLASVDFAQHHLDLIMAEGGGIIAIDTMDEDDLARAGALIWNNRESGRFVLGSQGIEYALIAHFRRAGLLGAAPSPPKLAPATMMPVVSGSVSPITAEQIEAAANAGFEIVPLDAAALIGGAGSSEAEIVAAIEASLRLMERGVSPLVCTACGPDDPAVALFRAARDVQGVSEADANAAIGAALGAILDALLTRTGVRRAAVAGGDTSGAVTKRLGVRALTALAATTPGAALFTAYREGERRAIELALKGGQMGAPDLFARLRDGDAGL